MAAPGAPPEFPLSASIHPNPPISVFVNRIRLMMAFGTVALIGAGGRDVWTAMANPKPAETTCEAFDPHVVKSKWVKLSGCRVNLLHAGNFYQGTDSTAAAAQIYVPLYAAGDTALEHTRVVMATSDPALLSVYNQLGTVTSEEAAREFVRAHRDVLEQVRPVSGLLRYGAGLPADERGKLAEFVKAPEYVVLDEGKEPTLMGGFAMMGGGAVLGLLTAASFGMRGRRRG